MSRNEGTCNNSLSREINFWNLNRNRNRQSEFNDALERELRNIGHQCFNNTDRSSSQNSNRCCCKEGLRRSLNIIMNPFIRSLIDLTSFRLIGQNAATSSDTTIKSVTNCNETTITFSDPETTAVNNTTICDLVAIQFDLGDTDIGDIDTLPELIAFFTRIIQRILPKMNTDRFCCKEETSCRCNQSKASFFANSVGPVNIVLNTSAICSLLEDLTVITVNNNVVWFIDDSGTVTIACLTDIVAFG